MSSRVCTVLLGLAFAVLPGLVPAQQPAAPAAATPDPRVQLAAKFPGARVEDLHPSPIPGVYEFSQGPAILYLSADGKYALNGDLLDLGTNGNITEQRRRSARARILADLPESEMVIFAPKDPKYTVTVFTDVDCAYCRELHRRIDEYNRLGIRVRYLAYPRSGPNTESWTKAEQVWCSADRNSALTAAKRDQPLPAKVCPNNPVASEYALGQNFDLQGTPAIVMPSGEMVQGYLNPAELARHLSRQN
jgi:thiol:disulfide interchange protein DsbC